MNMNLGWSTFKLKSDSGNEDNSDPNKEFSFDTLIGYQSYIYKEKEANENNLRYIVGTFGLKLGLTVIL